jgi:two-component system response regulator VicR
MAFFIHLSNAARRTRISDLWVSWGPPQRRTGPQVHYGTLTPARMRRGTPARMTLPDVRKRILCIEDDAEMIDLMRLILERRGFAVEGAEGGKAGLQAVRANPPDLVLLDLMMPDIDGWDVYQKMKADAATRHIPIIIVTASAQNVDREFGLHIAKVDDYIVKPFSPQDLLTSVDRVLSAHAAGA